MSHYCCTFSVLCSVRPLLGLLNVRNISVPMGRDLSWPCNFVEARGSKGAQVETVLLRKSGRQRFEKVSYCQIKNFGILILRYLNGKKRQVWYSDPSGKMYKVSQYWTLSDIQTPLEDKYDYFG